MDKTDFAKILASSSRSIGDIRTLDPALFAKLQGLAADRAKDRIAAVFADAPRDLRERITRLDLRAVASTEALDKARKTLAAGVSQAVAKDLGERLRRLEQSGALEDPLAQPDVLLRDLPLIRPLFEQARLSAVGDLAKLDQGALAKMLARAPSIEVLDDALGEMVAAGELTQQTALRLGFSAGLFRLCDESPGLAAAVIASPAGRSTVPPASLRDLCAHDAASWKELLQRSGVAAPGGMDLGTYARSLSRRIAALFPTEAFLRRLPPFDAKTGADRIRRLARLDPAAPEASVAHAELARLSNLYPGLGIAAVIADPALAPDEKANVVARRIGLLGAISAKHTDVELLSLDYAPGADSIVGLDFGGLDATPEEKGLALATLKAYQRVHALTDDIDDAHTLLAAGITSAASAATIRLDELRAVTGFDEVTARRHHDRAREVLAVTVAGVATLHETVRADFAKLRVHNVGPKTKDMLAELPGFTGLFGAVAHCRCDPCWSVLGPVAYFVDLMAYVDAQVRKDWFSKPGHPLDLKTRRPDLWSLPLTCENTNALIPTLQIVNEVLENYLVRVDASAAHGDRAEIESAVYIDTLATQTGSFRLPFVLPLARVEARLGQLGERRADIARAMGGSSAQVTRAELGIGVLEHRLITAPNLEHAALAALYGIPVKAVSGAIAVPVEGLMRAMGVARAELGALLATRFLGGAMHIVAEKKSKDSVQNDVENVHGLAPDALDRLHRFTRIQRRLPWSIAELDLVLHALDDTTLAALEPLIAVRRAQADLDTTVEETCALFGRLPSAPRQVDPSTPIVPRVLAGLRISDDDLRILTTRVADRPDSGAALALRGTSIALRERHARLAERLALTLPQLFQLIGLVDSIHAGVIDSLDDLTALLDAHAFWRASGYSLDDLGVILGESVLEPDAYPKAEEVARQVIATAAPSALAFSDTIFAAQLGVPESTSSAIVEALGAGVIRDGVLCRLADHFHPDVALELPASLGVAEADVRAVLRGYHPIDVVPRRLSAVLRVPLDKLAAIIELTARPMVGGGLSGALLVDPSQSTLPVAAAPLVGLIAALLPLVVLLKGPAFDADAVRFIKANPHVFGFGQSLPSLPDDAVSHYLVEPLEGVSLDLANVRALSVYARFIGGVARFNTDPSPVDSSDLRRALVSLAGPTPAVGDDTVLARLLGTTASAIASLRDHIRWTSPIAASRLDQIARAAALARTLGVDGAALAQMGADPAPSTAKGEATQLTRAAEALLAALRVRHANEAELQAQLDSSEDGLRAQRRDALTDYLMCSFKPPFPSRRAIYEYLLIDVDLEACSRTSRVVSATNSVQLYVQRCLMGLERDAAGTLEVEVGRRDPRIVGQWDWRRSYRIWQANRKVFLYPENYIEPDLRDDKTPLFEELQAELLQKQVDDQSVLDAYTAYTAGLDDVAKLTIAGAFYESATDTLHLLGVTASDPPTYHYRAVSRPFGAGSFEAQGTVFDPWRKINVQIASRRASPVVHAGRLHVLWVEIRTQSVNQVKEGSSNFDGYRHKLTLKLTTLRSDGKWTAPQEFLLPKDWRDSGGSAGTVLDRLTLVEPEDDLLSVPGLGPWRPRLDQNHDHDEPKDDYTLTGPNWDTVFVTPLASGLRVVLRNFRAVADVDLFRRTAAPIGKVAPAYQIPTPTPNIPLLSRSLFPLKLYAGYTKHWYGTNDAFANLAIDSARISDFYGEYSKADGGAILVDLSTNPSLVAELQAGTTLLAISGSPMDAILQVGADVIVLQRRRKAAEKHLYSLRRLGTALGDTVARTVFEEGVDGLLQSPNNGLKEPSAPLFSIVADNVKNLAWQRLDFHGPYGDYYRELFFHIPFLIADHLNSQGQFGAAQRWYHHIFDPTAKAPWRHLEFRDLDPETLREALTDQQAIAKYEASPWSPHAIARMRPSAYPKSVVMKYLDNLLDWGDSLFSQFTMESVSEATMLYTMAADILGDRPAEAGDCGEVANVLTYATLAPSLVGSPFLAEVETFILGQQSPVKKATRVEAPSDGVDPLRIGDALRANDPRPTPIRAARTASTVRRATTAALSAASPVNQGGAIATAADFAIGLLGQMIPVSGPAFCVPPNEELLGYWDRVNDRLHKIHNCLDIHGARRDLALFAPEIDPRLLAKMKAEGLTIDEVMSVTSGDLPPYRFVYLIEKAKASVATLQSLGGALLAALEKKDGEALARLRIVHEQHLGQMNAQLRKWEVDAAEEARAQAVRQREAAELRRDHYQVLVDGGLSAWERTEQAARHTVTAIRGGAPALWLLQGALGLIPQTGSPFAMTYGGKQFSKSVEGYVQAAHAIADVAETIAASTALEATFDRRNQEWRFQKDLADREIQALDRQVKAAEIRRQIAEKSLEMQQKTTEQTEEVYAFYADRFTSFGLYTWMATSLQRSYRQAYTSALALARLSEAAFRFERDEDPGLVVGEGAWDGARAGLLAGERLLLDLQALERRFIETNYRTLEVEQSFPLTQMDPTALLALRETGECAFTIPEVFFDLAYPGHYRRRIKAVRVTIPCVTGPHTNVGATLTLTASKVRVGANETPRAVPLQRTVSIATSRAQGDAGVFELSFHDERYMPFEGAGAAESAWTLTLPKSFRPFDYQTISDVVLTINYTALDDPGRRVAVAGQMAAAEQAIASYLVNGSLVRVFSLRREFPVAFKALMVSPPGTAVGFAIQDWHFPAFASGPGKVMAIITAKLALATSPGTAASGAQLAVDGETVAGFTADAALGGLAAKGLTGAFANAVKGAHTIAVVGGSALDEAKVVDVVIYVEYRVTM